jgi:multiple sugar transport system substrate-binding protein
MRTPLMRFAALAVVAALAFGACGGGNATASPAPTAAASATTAAVATPSGPATVPPGGPVSIRWFCCVGTGDAPEQVPVEKKVVDDFNKTHLNIKLTLEVVPYAGANAALATEIGSGSGPDIVGPAGIGGANAFHGQWLDLAPLIQKNNYDLSGFPQDAVNIYKLQEGQLGIPFAIYPSALFYKKSLFDEAGLAEPPHKYGDKYTLDGQQVEWNYDTARQVAMRLTVDRAGKDATEAGFDPKRIVQWGFEPQRDDLRGLGAYFGAGELAAADGKTAQIPEPWKTGWKWWYDGIWKDHFSMTNAQFTSSDINPKDYPFFTGKIAMSENFLWSTYGVADAGNDWNLGAIPSSNGTTTAAFNADTFRILKGTKHPDEAFTVLSYLLGEGAPTLLTAYGGFPARTASQSAAVDALQKQFKNTIDWQVAVDGIHYADNPNFESYMPAYNESLKLVGSGGKYLTKWASQPNLDMDKEFELLRAELQAIWDKAT